ncbi:MAG: YqaA family protein [Verrucomicrobiota bacterium]|nr:YqaA family protein [Verrucomicrobiota bacterium]
MNPLRSTYNWTLSLAHKKRASSWLAALSFSEASFFPIPPDVLLIPLCLGNIRKALKFALICSIASVLGGLVGYLIGAFAWDMLQGLFFSYVPGFTPEKFERISAWYGEWGWPLVFLAGFSPIPYKVFTIASGVMGMALLPFLLASAVSRSARFFLVAILISKFGEPIKEKIDRHFNLLALVFGLLLVGGFLAIKFLTASH